LFLFFLLLYGRRMSGGFADLGLMPELLQAVDDMNWVLPTDIQDESIPLILGGGDVMGAAETGSGKTAAFGLPVLQLVHERLKSTTSDSTSSVSASATGSNSRKRQLSLSSTHDSNISVSLNRNDRDSAIQLAEDNNYLCKHIPEPDNGGAGAWVGIRATHGVRQGKYAFEVIVQPPAGHCRVGWSTMSAHLMLGKDGQGFGYGGTGFKSHDGSFDKYGGNFTAGDVITCYIDLSSPKMNVAFSKNGASLGVAFEIEEELVGSVFFPAIALSNAAAAEVNFGQCAPRFPLEHGYQWIQDGATSGDLFGSGQADAYVVQGKRLPLAIILEPTRDLAQQVYQNLLDLSRYISEPELRLMLLIGEGNNQQVKQSLKAGVDIVIGTLGKIQALIEQKQLDLSHIRHFILDEADKMLSTENFETIKFIFGKCPGGGVGDHRLQVCFFSATLHSPVIQSLAASICHNPLFVDLKGKDLVPETLHHVVYSLDPAIDYNEQAPSFSSASGITSSTSILPITDGVHGEDLRGQVKSALDATEALSLRVKQQKVYAVKHLIDRFEMQQVLIFCRTNLDCLNLQAFFQQVSRQQGSGGKGSSASGSGGSIVVERYSSRVLGSALSQEQREASLASFRAQEARILICTDVAARGIDIDSLPYVINMTLPDEPEHYLHRIGRAGRRGFTGLAISIVNLAGPEKVWFHNCKIRGGQLTNHRYACQNRNLTSAQGCTVYYDERQCLQKIETHLHNTPILRMNAETMELPEELRVLNIRYGNAGKETGESTNAGAKKVYMTEKVVGRLRSLVELETQAQNFFLSLQS
jgi:ATP-dependent RNA helicase DDX1